MKIIKKLTAFLLLIVTLLNFMGCEKTFDLGVPSLEKHPAGVPARCMWDVKVFDGKVYVGMGDYSSNTSPTDIWAYDIDTSEWIKSGTVEDEAVLRFIELDGTLVAPGTDPAENWDYGNYYTLKNGIWEKSRVLPDVIHNFDIVDFDGKRIYGVGADYGIYPALYTTDGENFTYFDFYKNNELYQMASEYYARGYEFFAFNNQLYVLVRHNHAGQNTASLNIFKYDNGAFYYYCDATEFFKSVRVSENIINAKAEFSDKYFFVTDYLYYTTQTDAFKTNYKVTLPNDEKVASFKIIEDEMLILSYLENEDGTYSITFYETELGTEDFDKVYSFTYDVPPVSFDVFDGYAYVGMGNRVKFNKANGTMLKIKI